MPQNEPQRPPQVGPTEVESADFKRAPYDKPAIAWEELFQPMAQPLCTSFEGGCSVPSTSGF